MYELASSGLVVRILLLVYGHWQDHHLEVKYTDIDYQVFTDAARFVASGGSPYQRSTYRYTPLLAWLLLGNVWLHPAWGKVLFCIADMFAARLIEQLLRLQHVTPANIRLAVGLWLLNPLTVAISTRGNGEALVSVLLLGVLLLLFKGKYKRAAVLFGLAVHWRVYPVIYMLPILLVLPGRDPDRHDRPCGMVRGGIARLLSLISWPRIQFAALFGTTFLALGALCYAMYGDAFVQEAFLHHARRRDPRHSFSVYFYPVYLSYGTDARALDVTRLAFPTQLVSTVAIGMKWAHHLPVCLLLQTLAFVAFNKVCTSQYFVWYLTFLPLVLPWLLQSPHQKRLLGALAAWVLAQAHWLAWAYLLEFKGQPVFLTLWVASILFFVSNLSLMWAIASSFPSCVPFRDKMISWQQTHGMQRMKNA